MVDIITKESQEAEFTELYELNIRDHFGDNFPDMVITAKDDFMRMLRELNVLNAAVLAEFHQYAKARVEYDYADSGVSQNRINMVTTAYFGRLVGVYVSIDPELYQKYTMTLSWNFWYNSAERLAGLKRRYSNMEPSWLKKDA